MTIQAAPTPRSLLSKLSGGTYLCPLLPMMQKGTVDVVWYAFTIMSPTHNLILEAKRNLYCYNHLNTPRTMRMLELQTLPRCNWNDCRMSFKSIYVYIVVSWFCVRRRFGDFFERFRYTGYWSIVYMVLVNWAYLFWAITSLFNIPWLRI